MATFNEGGEPDLRDQFRQEYTTQQAQVAAQRKKRSAWKIGIVGGVLLLLLILGGSACGTYNSLQSKREVVRTQWSNVDVQLQRRADLIPNLVSTVKGYAKHEEQVFSEIAAARSRLLSAQGADEKAQANDQLTASLGRLLVLAENYPDLKASEQFKSLQFQLEGTENRIGVARRDYNQAVLGYNTSRQQFPTVVMANLLGFERAEEFKADEASREVPKVSF